MSDSPSSKGAENTSAERVSSVSEGQKERQENSKEIKNASVGKDAYIEALGFDESTETTGKVSEVLSKDQDNGGQGGGAKGQTQNVYDPAHIKAMLLKNLPPEKMMRNQIEREIKKEVKYLHSKAMRMLRSPGNMSYFEMANLMKKIRELKGILILLLKASVDGLKTLWLRFVHGIM